MVYIPTKEPPISLETTLANAKAWLNIIRYREYGTILHLQDDSVYRVEDLIGNPKILRKFLGPYHRKYLLEFIPNDQTDLISSIKSTLIKSSLARGITKDHELSTLGILEILDQIGQEGFEVALFISGIARLLDEPDYHSLFELEHILEKAKNISVILFCERDLTGDNYKHLTTKCSLIFDHIIKYPLYEQEDSRQFIKYNNSMWKMKLNKDLENEIIHQCGGYLWLISDMQRYIRDNPKSSIDDASNDFVLFQKLEAIWLKFTDIEKSIINKVIKNNLHEEDISSHEYEYLVSLRILLKSNEKTVLGIPLLSKVIDKEIRVNSIQLKENQIFVHEKDVTDIFSLSEQKLLKLLLNNKKTIVPREKVALILWGDKWEDKYSDWAIDRLAYRIRKKLIGLEIDPKLFKTAKRKGFSFG